MRLLPAAVLMLVAAGAASAAPAPATPDRPVLLPTRDVAVAYRQVAQGATTPLVMRYTAATQRLRLDGGNMPGYVVVDARVPSAAMVMPQHGMFMDVPPAIGVVRAFTLDPGMKFRKGKEETVAGNKCTLWDITGKDGSGTACITADGVVLTARGRLPQGTGAIEATKVEYVDQPAALFDIPANLRRVDLPSGVPTRPLRR